NGLQVEGKAQIRHLVSGVSVSERLFREAAARKADAVLVHHGFFWKSDPHPYVIRGIRKRRLKILLENDINLYAYHLPLDAHPEVGNNIEILRRLNIPPLEAVEVGFIGYVNRYTELDDLVLKIADLFEAKPQVFAFGKTQVQKILVISGSSSPACEKAAELGIDTFLGGDIREEQVRVCEELGLNFIAAGHYNTEKFGVQALSQHLAEKFGLKTEFIDIPNPV
ncbi:MAG TPA: Nif3-like dinuclear metal center hexameric protein, partial [Bacteroidetes bacterium]|nr:Nif3-like dinuclear metal center hexameric protein [Bacteroidota bacterium]